ncbi:MAG: flagellar hook-associated protein FlgL [Nitrospirae bacterium]|nr:flagellar hook-associated protein FlgL [Nitrospirota bacterium]MBF0533537.1 flagellar hook-associated protein FlgL [Nitrospirota bacterium]MBF0615939.1 flagellar hook-associated protein FlgL [Nitrospirota bacterium]
MGVRMSQFLTNDRVTYSLQSNFGKLFNTQEQMASGLRINRPSDDTVAESKVLDYKLTINDNGQFQRNMNDAKGFLDASETAMNTLTDNLQRLDELIVDGTNGSRGPSDRIDIGQEVSTIRQGIYQLANTKYELRNIFSGQKVNQQAFSTSGSAYIFNGDGKPINVDINYTARITENITASAAFMISMATTQTIRLDNGTFAHYIPSKKTIGQSVMVGSVPTIQNYQVPQITITVSNSSNPTAAGISSSSFTNYMEMVEGVENAFNSNNVDMMQAYLKPIQLALDNTATVRATIGARANYIDRTNNALDDTTMQTQEVLSNYQDADIAKVVSDLSKSELAMQALRQSSFQIMSESLLNYLK